MILINKIIKILKKEDDKMKFETIAYEWLEYKKISVKESTYYNYMFIIEKYLKEKYENKKIEELIRQREENIALAGKLKEVMEAVVNKDENWKEKVKASEEDFSEDIIEPLNIIGKAKDDKSEDYQDAMKLLHARVNNWESNLHIEIDMERIEDRSKALSYIGIEIADALKSIPTPVEEIQEQPVVENTEKIESHEAEKVQVASANEEEKQQYAQETTFEAKPSLWQRFKNSKFVRAVKAITRIRIVLDYPDALPEGRGENKQ